VVRGDRLQLRAGLRNDGRAPLSLAALQAAGLSVRTDLALPVPLPPRGATVDLLLELRVTDCAAARTEAPDGPLRAHVADADDQTHQVVLPMSEPVAASYDELVRQRCR
jgi:hypothetical protein